MEKRGRFLLARRNCIKSNLCWNPPPPPPLHAGCWRATSWEPKVRHQNTKQTLATVSRWSYCPVRHWSCNCWKRVSCYVLFSYLQSPGSIRTWVFTWISEGSGPLLWEVVSRPICVGYVKVKCTITICTQQKSLGCSICSWQRCSYKVHY